MPYGIIRTISTIRFYDKEGLLPNIKRENGKRIFTEDDFKWLKVLNCLKNIGMPLKEIREYLELAQKGDNSLKERYNIILNQKQNIKDQIKMLKQSLKKIGI